MSVLALFVAPPLLAACVADIRFRIIPDMAVLSMAGIGLVVAMQQPSVLPALAAGSIALAVGMGFWWLGGWGMGDAKLLGASGLLVGPSGLPVVLAVMALAGGVMAILVLMLSARARAGRLVLPAGAPRWLRVEARRLRLAPSLPYGLAIAAGLVAAVLVER